VTHLNEQDPATDEIHLADEAAASAMKGGPLKFNDTAPTFGSAAGPDSYTVRPPLLEET